jgi:hypothetical protein
MISLDAEAILGSIKAATSDISGLFLLTTTNKVVRANGNERPRHTVFAAI